MGAVEQRRPGTAGLRQLRLGGHLRRDRVSEEGENGAADHRAEARALLAGDDARSVRLRPLAREPDAALDRAGERQAPERPAPANALAQPQYLDSPGRRGGRTPRHPRRRSCSAGRARRTQPRQRLPPLGRSRAGLQRPQAGAALHGLQLRAAPRSVRAGAARGRVPARARPLPRHRPHARRPVRRPRPRPARGRPLQGRPLPRALAVRGHVAGGAPAASRRADALRRRRRDRDLAALDRRLHVRREPAGDGWGAAAGALRRRGETRLLPALRGRDGADAADARGFPRASPPASPAASTRTAAGR